MNRKLELFSLQILFANDDGKCICWLHGIFKMTHGVTTAQKNLTH